MSSLVRRLDQTPFRVVIILLLLRTDGALPFVLMCPNNNLAKTPTPTTSQSNIKRSHNALFNSKSSSSFSLPTNEFSRTISPERILKHHRPGRSSSNNPDYQLSLSATHDERDALAVRFDLKHIDSLEANVAVRAEHAAHAGGVEVEGRVVAAVTQTCVRTNEDFPVQLEFPLYAIVRPVIPVMASTTSTTVSSEDEGTQNMKKNKNKSKQSVSYRSNVNNDMDLMELQRMFQQEFVGDDEFDSALMEDEAIYPMGGNIDIGELVAQLFWLSLDPYPKRPGTDPIQTTITG